MATIEELIQQYETDPELKKEVEQILEDGKITIKEFTSFAKKHNVDISLKELPNVIKEAKKLGFIK
ncbi:MAG: hypothetical protein ACSW79_00670 [Eubacteriales bacterium]|jgi:predicted transcriptional regulator|nr:hypothetical protein [Clostridia bacterium]